MGSHTLSEKWKLFLSVKRNRNELIISVIVLSAVLFSLTRFLNYVEAREGVVLNDPILNLFNPINLTWVIFALIYISLISALVILIKNPVNLLFAIQVYFVMVIFRITAMYILPLNPPADMIALSDPFAEIFGTGRLMTKDLFFSGHTASLFIFYLSASNKKHKLVFLICTIAVAISVLLQHVHYTIDVLSAPFFTYCAYVIVKKFREHYSPFII